MSELEKEYGDRINFNIVSAEETKNRFPEIELYGFAELRHGLVALTAEGEALAKIPGHNFGREEIVNALEVVLAARKPKDLRARAFDS